MSAPKDTNHTAHPKRSRHKRWGIIIALAIIVVSAAIAVWFFQNNQNTDSTASKNGDNSQQDGAGDGTIPVLSEEIERKANIAKFSGDTEAAVKIYNEELSKMSSKTEKAEVHLRIAVLYVNDGEDQKALESALEAERQTGETLANVTFIATVYERLKNYPKAIEYYQAAEKISPNEGATAGDKEYYQQKIEELKAK